MTIKVSRVRATIPDKRHSQAIEDGVVRMKAPPWRQCRRNGLPRLPTEPRLLGLCARSRLQLSWSPAESVAHDESASQGDHADHGGGCELGPSRAWPGMTPMMVSGIAGP